MRSGLCLQNIPSCLSFDAANSLPGAGGSGQRLAVCLHRWVKDADTWQCAESSTALIPERWSGEADTTHLSTDPGVSPAASQSIPAKVLLAQPRAPCLPSHGLLLPQELPACQCLQLPSLERSVPLSCFSLTLSQMLQLPSLCLFPLASVLSTGIALGKGAGKVLKTYITSKTVISAE